MRLWGELGRESSWFKILVPTPVLLGNGVGRPTFSGGGIIKTGGAAYRGAVDHYLWRIQVESYIYLPGLWSVDRRALSNPVRGEAAGG